MSALTKFYHNMVEELQVWLEDEPVTRVRNLALAIVGVQRARSVHMSRIVEHWPLEGRENSLVNRLRRFLSNPAVKVAEWYEPFARTLLEQASRCGKVRLAIDQTQVSTQYRGLFISLVWRKTSVPLAWCLKEGTRGKMGIHYSVRLLRQVQAWLPAGQRVELVLLGDSAFRAGDLAQWLLRQQRHDWYFVIRQRDTTTYRAADEQWHPIGTIPLKQRQTRILGPVWLAKTNPVGPVHLVLHWGRGQEKPWLLMTNLPNPSDAVRLYRQRMRVETLFSNWKRRGFDLERSCIRRLDRLDRLLLVVAIATVWVVATGSWVIKNSLRPLVDRRRRRDKSHFRIGFDFVARCFRLDRTIPIRLLPYY